MNTINNVPRELLEEVMLAAQRMPVRGPSIRAKLHAILSAPSPAGVDGLEVFAWSEFDGEGGHELRLYENNETFLTDWLARNGYKYADWVEPLCRLSDAQAIIDWLREDRDIHQRACIRAMEKRDQQAQRIGELASHLEFAVTMLTVAGLAGNAQVEAMRATLSAGKEGE